MRVFKCGELPPPKGGELVLTFAFVPLPPRSRTLPRSLARALCWPLPFGDNPCRVFPEPFSGARRHFMPSGRGPPARVPYGKTVHRTDFAYPPALRLRLSLENACRRSLGGFRSLRAATRWLCPRDPRSLERLANFLDFAAITY